MATGRGKSLIFHLHAARTALAGGRRERVRLPAARARRRPGVPPRRSVRRGGSRRPDRHRRDLPRRARRGVRGSRRRADARRRPDDARVPPLSRRALRRERAGSVSSSSTRRTTWGWRGRGTAPRTRGSARRSPRSGGPTVLAVTATASDEVARIDPRVRSASTQSCSTRPCATTCASRIGGTSPTRTRYVAALAARGEKIVVYVNSREQSVRIARMLRKAIPELAMRTAFYNGGLSRAARHAVERAFRDGDVRVVVATSAFGEGVNIPDMRDVVLYHLPFNDVEFNQMCGRAGATARPHASTCCSATRTRGSTRVILSSARPEPRRPGGALPRAARIAEAEGAGFEVTNAELAERAASARGIRARRARCVVGDRHVPRTRPRDRRGPRRLPAPHRRARSPEGRA